MNLRMAHVRARLSIVLRIALTVSTVFVLLTRSFDGTVASSRSPKVAPRMTGTMVIVYRTKKGIVIAADRRVLILRANSSLSKTEQVKIAQTGQYTAFTIVHFSGSTKRPLGRLVNSWLLKNGPGSNMVLALEPLESKVAQSISADLNEPDAVIPYQNQFVTDVIVVRWNTIARISEVVEMKFQFSHAAAQYVVRGRTVLDTPSVGGAIMAGDQPTFDDAKNDPRDDAMFVQDLKAQTASMHDIHSPTYSELASYLSVRIRDSSRVMTGARGPYEPVGATVDIAVIDASGFRWLYRDNPIPKDSIANN